MRTPYGAEFRQDFIDAVRKGEAPCGLMGQ
jgi:hypothetical protein